MAENFEQWIGRQRSHTELLHPFPLKGLAATLDKSATELVSGCEIPPLWHWLYFLEPALQGTLDADGHPCRGEFLPPSKLPRRMWAGSRLQFLHPLYCGREASQHSRIKSVVSKQGKTGPLLFVTVSHAIHQDDRHCLSEEQDIVFRGQAGTGSTIETSTADLSPDFQLSVAPDPTLLFRYSALTFNAHRIHYDRDYAVKVENYPGLVVHGPLMATLMLELLRANTRAHAITSFSFRALAPVFDLQPFRVCACHPDAGGECQLWVENNTGGVCMQARASLD